MGVAKNIGDDCMDALSGMDFFVGAGVCHMEEQLCRILMADAVWVSTNLMRTLHVHHTGC